MLILDEATSALDIATRDRLFTIVHRLTDEGVGVVFITHRMDEISEIGDRITVMRNGETVSTLARGGWTPQELVRLMTGTDEKPERRPRSREQRAGEQRQLLMSVRGMSLSPDRAPFDVQIYAGELVGVAGLEGHGQNDFLEALRGAGSYAGEVVRHNGDGEELTLRSLGQAADQGVAYVPRERAQSIFRWMSIQRNFGMPTLTRDRRAGLLWPSSTRRRLENYVSRLNVVLGHADDRITTLSGGNQQKVVVARWLAAEPKVLLLNDPTRGIDIGAKSDLYALLTGMADAGLAVVMLSTELDEHIELMDRVLVFRDHELFREITQASLSRHALVAAFFGEARTDEE